jgi:PAS domain S-box-containing protein
LRWLEVRGRNLLDDPVVGGIIVNSRDVTEKRTSRHELNSIIDNLPGYVYRHRYEPGWPLEFVKGSAEQITGYTTTELEDNISLAEDIIHPEDREAVWEGVQEGLEETNHFDLTYRITTKDGAERWIRDQGQLIEDPMTGEEFLDGFIVDVTDQKERERQLKQQKRRYEAIFNDPNIFIGLIDTDGTVLDINRTALEYTETTFENIQGELLQETPWFDHSVDVQQRVATGIERAADGEYVEFDLELVRRDGTPYTVEAAFRPVRDEDGAVVSLIISGRNINDGRDAT